MYIKSGRRFIEQSAMQTEKLKQFCLENNIPTKLNEPMSAHTSLRIGGTSDIALYPDEGNIKKIIDIISEDSIPYMVIGKGTNLLIKDGGIEGALIFTDRFNKITNITDDGQITVHAGCLLQKIITLSAELGFSGMEGLAGIPGTVGGAIAGNAGSFGYEIMDVVDSICILTDDGNIKTLSKSEAGFAYRSSKLPANSIIIDSYFSLKNDDQASVKKRIKEFVNEKRLKHPLNLASAGCVFKNPDGMSAGKLIDEAGCKGMSIGGIMVSRLHANYFINSNGGTAGDFLRLMDIVKEAVSKKFGILLEPEIKIIGRD